MYKATYLKSFIKLYIIVIKDFQSNLKYISMFDLDTEYVKINKTLYS